MFDQQNRVNIIKILECAWRWDHCIDVSQIIKIRNINEWGREGRSDGDYERSEEGIPIHSAINANTCSVNLLFNNIDILRRFSLL